MTDPESHGFQFALLFRESGEIRLIARTFTPHRGKGRNIEIAITRNACPSPECHATQVMGLGMHKEADEALSANPAIWQLPPVEFIKYTINVEINHHPDDVGLPIAIVQMDNTGAIRWIANGACANFK